MRDAGPRAPSESDPPMSDPTSGIRRTPSLGHDAVKPSDVETIADAVGTSQPALPNWNDRDADERPGWDKAGIPREEWLRAKANNDARIAKAAPGSEEFSRLMEARLRMHLGPPPAVDFREISEFKKSVYREHLQGDLEAEIRQKEGRSPVKARFFVAIALLVLVVGVLALIVLRGSSEEPSPAPSGPSKADQSAPVEALPTASAAPAREPTEPTAKAAPTVDLSVKPAPTTKTEVTSKPDAPPKPDTSRPSTTTPPPKPTATGETPFFR